MRFVFVHWQLLVAGSSADSSPGLVLEVPIRVPEIGHIFRYREGHVDVNASSGNYLSQLLWESKSCVIVTVPDLYASRGDSFVVSWPKDWLVQYFAKVSPFPIDGKIRAKLLLLQPSSNNSLLESDLGSLKLLRHLDRWKDRLSVGSMQRGKGHVTRWRLSSWPAYHVFLT